jgi:hypothetical protein
MNEDDCNNTNNIINLKYKWWMFEMNEELDS